MMDYRDRAQSYYMGLLRFIRTTVLQFEGGYNPMQWHEREKGKYSAAKLLDELIGGAPSGEKKANEVVSKTFALLRYIPMTCGQLETRPSEFNLGKLHTYDQIWKGLRMVTHSPNWRRIVKAAYR